MSASRIWGADRICVADVGLGTCVLFQANDQNFLFDAGPEDTASKVIRLIADHKVTWIDAIFISHDHSDHIGGLQKILETIPTNTVFWPGNCETPSYVKKLQADPFNRTKVILIGPGAGIKLKPGLTINFLAQSTLYNHPNDNSIVFGIEDNKHKILIAGDIGKTRRADLVQLEPQWLKKTNWLLWPHHGETLEPVFMSAFQKKPICVVSVGENPVQLPSPQLQEQADSFCSILYRTDAMSDLDFRLDRQITLESTESLRSTSP